MEIWGPKPNLGLKNFLFGIQQKLWFFPLNEGLNTKQRMQIDQGRNKNLI